ncbi:MAG: EamA family transporter [Armatimonadota bacterium]
MAIALAVLIAAILLGAVGQIALKTGINLLGEKPAPLLVLRSIFTQWQVTAGFVCYGLSSLLYLVALSRLPLSYAYPMVAVSYVVVTFLSWRFLHETVPMMRVAGLAVVCMGVVLVALSYKPAAAASAPPTAIHAAPDSGAR